MTSLKKLAFDFIFNCAFIGLNTVCQYVARNMENNKCNCNIDIMYGKL